MVEERHHTACFETAPLRDAEVNWRLRVSPLPEKKLQNARDYNFRIVADLFYRPECKGGAAHLSFMTLSAGPRKPKHGVHISLDTPPSASLHEHEPRNRAAHFRVGALVLLQKPIIVDDVPHGYTPTVQVALEHIHLLLADSRPSPTRQVTRPQAGKPASNQLV